MSQAPKEIGRSGQVIEIRDGEPVWADGPEAHHFVLGDDGQWRDIDRQRLKEAIWRINGLIYQGRLAKYRRNLIERELALLADALGVEPLTR